MNALKTTIAAVALGFAATTTAHAATDEWPTATPAEAGFAADLNARFDAAFAGGAYDGVHAVVLVRGGKLVLERYLTGDDERYGRRKNGVIFNPDMLHDVRSISKSVVGLLYGIALDEGTVPTLDTTLLEAFPEYRGLDRDPDRQAITIAHVLAMTMGTAWDENVPYSDPANSEIAMNRAADSLRYVLDRPMAGPPGKTWTYNGGTTTLLGELIARGNGGDLRSYANEKLFRPLGIEKFEWVGDYYGRPHAASGLRLRPRDMAKIGQLILQSGLWNGERIVPADWIAASTLAHAPADYGCRYSYQWWLCQTKDGVPLIEGAGWGGQELLVQPDLGLVFVVNAGLYGDPDAWKRAFGLLESIVLPALASDQQAR